MDKFESEDVKIDGWESRLPSDICTNRNIFDQIFSLDTFNNVLGPEQRQRLIQLLPKEVVSSTPDLIRQTVEDLFQGELLSFSQSPLDNFFVKLDSGQYDPVVTRMKHNIKRELKKESIRQLKNYHTKLLEDIVVSRHRYLNRLRATPLTNNKRSRPSRSKAAKEAAAAAKNKQPAFVGVLQNASSELNTKLSNIPPIGTNNNIAAAAAQQGGKGKPQQKSMIKVEEQKNTTSGGGSTPLTSNLRKRRGGKEDPSLSAGDGSNSGGKPPAAKKPTKSKVPPTISGNNNESAPPPTTKKSGKGQGKSELNQVPTTSESKGKNVILQQQKPANIAPVKILDPKKTSSAIIRQQEPQISVPPQHKRATSFVTHSSSSSHLLASTDSSILNAALTSDKLLLKSSSTTPSTTTLTSSNIYNTSPAKSSPILASQLQASPQISVKMEDSLNFFSSGNEESGPDSGCITLNYQKLEEKSSGEDESSSDEFEAIQPTIGLFGTSTIPAASTKVLLSSSSGNLLQQQQIMSTTSSILPTIPPATTTLETTGNRIIQVQQSNPQQQDITEALGPNSFVTVTVSTAGNNKLSSQSNPVYILSTTNKNLSSAEGGVGVGQQHHGRIILQKDALKSLPISSQQLALMSNNNSSKIIVKGSSTNLLDQQQQQQQQFVQHKAMVATTTTTGLHHHGHHTQEIIRISNADLMNAKSTGTGVHYVTNSGKNIILHPMSSSSNLLHLQASPPSTTSTSICKIIPSSSSSSTITSLSSSGQRILTSNNTSFANLNLATPTSGSSVEMGSSSSQLKSLDGSSLSLNSSSLLNENDELNNLSLSSLGSLGLGMNTSNLSNISGLDGIMECENMKLEMDVIDKIDDLSVLDGNPFDSIPNLSDELDGLDLDLVDGLCDFEGLLSDEKKYPSFFSLIREVLCSTRDHRMTLLCMEKTIRKWASSPGAALNSWFLNVADWNKGLMTALNFLAGTYQDVHPEDFVPYIEYKYKTKYYQWIGAGRDGDNNLAPLCSIWMDNLERLPSIKKIDGETEDQEEEDEENEDSELTEDAKKKNKRPLTPPPPRCVTDWTVRPSSDDEKNLFRIQERSRFDNPHKAFTYNMHCYESVVGPVKGVYSSQAGMTNKARGHSLLVDDRPPYVTILALVRDAVARLPNGEGTRSEICEMLRDSAFLAPDASSVTLNSVVSGALDRLHYERDPCVRYDSHKKSWIYLHRDRTQEQFERLHHNRSYTKSTKSRNNTTRKSRRSTAKSATSTSSVTTPLSTSSALGSGSSSTSTSPVSSSATADNNNCTTGIDDQLPSAAGEPIKLITSGLTLSAPAKASGSLMVQHPQIIQVNSGPSSTAPSDNSQQTTDPRPAGEIQIKSDGGLSYPVGIASSNNMQTIKLTPLPLHQQQQQQPELSASSSATLLATKVTSGNNVIVSTSAGGIPVQYLVQTSSASPSSIMTSSSSVGSQQQNTIQLHSSGRTMQFQGFPSASLTASSAGGGGETILVSGHQQQTGQTTSATTSQGQMLFGPQTVLRIANALRLSQLRLPANSTGGGGMPGSVRAPAQHRILLTRGAVPGQPGILLGHTSTGQTVILSTTGEHGFPTLSTSNQAHIHALAQLQQQQQEGTVVSSSGNNSSASLEVSNSSSPTLTTYSLRPMLGKPQPQGVSILGATRPMMTPTIQNNANNNSGRSVFDMNSSSSPKMIQLNIAAAPGGQVASSASLMKSAIVTSNTTSSQSPLVATSTITTTATGNIIPSPKLQGDSSYVITASPGPSTTTTLGGIQTQRHPVGYTIATVRGNTMAFQGQGQQPSGINRTIQLQAIGGQNHQLVQSPGASSSSLTNTDSSSGNNMTPTTTPIIIRSVAGDLMLPGHIALGKGGIKLFPFPVGNKTMLAKIIPPNNATTATPNVATASTTNPTHRLVNVSPTTTMNTTPTTTDIPMTSSTSTTSFNLVSTTKSVTSPTQTQPPT